MDGCVASVPSVNQVLQLPTRPSSDLHQWEMFSGRRHHQQNANFRKEEVSKWCESVPMCDPHLTVGIQVRQHEWE